MISKKSKSVLIGLLLIIALTGCGQAPPNGLLTDFEQESDMDTLFWQCKTWFERSDQNSPQGKYWLKAELPPGDFPGIRFTDLPTNWSGYKALSFVAWAPGKAGTKLHLRIDDQNAGPNYEDRFNTIFTLEENPKKYCVDISSSPKNLPGKKLNRRHIDLLMFFLYNQHTTTTLYLDDIKLLHGCH